MKYNNVKMILKSAVMALLAVTLTAGPSLAAELAAVPAQWSPDGGTTTIPIWGFVEVADAAAYACPGTVAWTGGPTISVPAGLLTINVKNCLSENISVFIPGLAKDASDPLVPQTTTDGQGRERLTSMDDTVAAGATGSYTWNATEGTYLFQSGTDIRTQVPMGLYGALVVTGTGYPAVAKDEVLLFSEIDPALNANPAGFGGARVSSWSPQYFLINGATSPDTADLTIDVSTDVLLRFVNAGLETFIPTLEGGLYMDVIAEDGNLYPYPLTQYGIELQAGKTYDAVINAGTAGTYKLYDRSLHLTNGGLVVAIQAGAAAGAPTAANDTYSVAEEGSLIATASGSPPGVLDNDSIGTGPGPLTASLVTDVSAGTLTLSLDGSFTYTPNADFNGIDQFTYVANDGGPDSNVATATITVTPVNDAPVAVADAYDAPEGGTLNVAAPGVLGNDEDVDGDTLNAVVSAGPPAGATLVLNTNGSFDYTPAGVAGAVETFDYAACDAEPLCSTATVTITVVTVANTAPTAIDDFPPAVTRGSTGVIINLTDNDVDPDGTIIASSVVITTGGTTQRGGTVTNNGNGTVTYDTPSPGWRGTDTFQYTVNDNDGATSDPATVHINVVK